MLQPSGPISLLDLKNEFGDTDPVSLGDYYRGGQFVPSSQASIPATGPIALNNFYGVSKGFVLNKTISVDTMRFDLAAFAASFGWDGIIPLIATITVSSGAVVYSNDTAVPAFLIPSSIPAESNISIINNGFIIGMGGRGGGNSISQVGQNGGPAMNVAVACSITNNGIIGGGGGGGGYCGAAFSASGGGGGRSGRVNSAGGTATASPGGAGTFAAAGAGGVYSKGSRIGGDGGNWGASGGAATGGTVNYAGGAGGAAVIGNANVTWLATGTRMGALT